MKSITILLEDDVVEYLNDKAKELNINRTALIKSILKGVAYGKDKEFIVEIHRSIKELKSNDTKILKDWRERGWRKMKQFKQDVFDYLIDIDYNKFEGNTENKMMKDVNLRVITANLHKLNKPETVAEYYLAKQIYDSLIREDYSKTKELINFGKMRLEKVLTSTNKFKIADYEIEAITEYCKANKPALYEKIVKIKKEENI